jgi:hypothetical protein
MHGRRSLIGCVLLTALVQLACDPGPLDNSPLMRPGENCVACHRSDSRAPGRSWTAAGTVFDAHGTSGVEGAEVLVVDARGIALTLTTNGAGNFYTGETLVPPFTKISLGYNGSWQDMPLSSAQGPVDGSCNYCHSAEGSARLNIRIK